MNKWVFLMIICTTIHANNPVLSQHEKGWYWHDDVKKVEETVLAKKAEPTVITNPDKTWKLVGKMVERARAKAILNPTPENIANARRTQRLVVAQANLFSQRWMLDLLLHPENDESLTNPNNSSARDLYNQQNNLLKEKAISQSTGLYYFYDGGEPFSEAMAEVVRDFAQRYLVPVIPVSMNTRYTSLFPESRSDNGQAKNMGVKHIPAVFTLHPLTKKAMPVAYGLVSQSELKENILMVTNAYSTGAFNEK
jgi:conjugal transfer pilus assembly protein TraF